MGEHESELLREGCGRRECTQPGRTFLAILRVEGSLIMILASPSKW